jgi:hypothetical protein
MEFYETETDELGWNVDNWFGPTTECLMALCRSAGFARVEHMNTRHHHATVLCHRKWEPEPAAPTCAPPVLSAALHTRNYGVNFRAGKEEYVTFWFSSPLENLDRRDLRPKISGFGAPALSLNQGMPGQYGFGAPEILSREETLQRLPTIRQNGLRGGVIYYDGQFDDARLLINMVTTAAEQGATLVNYCRVRGLTKAGDGFVSGVVATDEESGEEFTATARIVVNATGPFTDSVRRLADPTAQAMIAHRPDRIPAQPLQRMSEFALYRNFPAKRYKWRIVDLFHPLTPSRTPNRPLGTYSILQHPSHERSTRLYS